MKLLLIFLAGAAIFYLQRLLYKRIWDRGLEVRVRFGDAFVYEGQTTEITEEVVNDKGFPLPALEIRGLMTIAPNVSDPEKNRPVFRRLKELSVDIAGKNINNVTMNVLSMGMTGDYQVAVEEGATIVRVGTGIFGQRAYSVQD